MVGISGWRWRTDANRDLFPAKLALTEQSQGPANAGVFSGLRSFNGGTTRAILAPWNAEGCSGSLFGRYISIESRTSNAE